MKRKKPISIAIFILVCTGCAMMAAQQNHETHKAISPHHHDTSRHNCAACHTLSKAEAEALLQSFGAVKDVRPAPVKGLYEVIPNVA